jgi:choline dehydrogenase
LTDSYEYVVVGSGAGGGPLAARLAMAGKKTLLIEAGNDQGDNLNYEIPTHHPIVAEDPAMGWEFYVNHFKDPAMAARDDKLTWDTPDGKAHVGNTAPAGSKHRGIFYPRAGVLGGCTAHNAMVSIYPQERDWEYIQKLTGDNTWNPVSMRGHFAKLEANNYNSPPQNMSGHGKDGWLTLTTIDPNVAGNDAQVTDIAMGAVETMAKTEEEKIMGLSNLISDDLNDWTPGRDHKEGIFFIPLSIKDGRRAGSRDIILNVYNAKTADGKKKYPLDIALNTFVTKILFTPSGTGAKPRATGVEFLHGEYLYSASPLAKKSAKGEAGKVTAEKEVIISAGTFNTPQLLKISGIGPKAELEKLKIPVIADSPGVGTNLQDHMEIGITHEFPQEFNVSKGCTLAKANDPCVAQWKEGKGIYTQSNGFPYAVIKKTSVAAEDKDFGGLPDVILFGGPANFGGYFPKYSDTAFDGKNWTWVVLRAHTENNHGTVLLKSSDPLDTPSIDLNFFEAGNKVASKRDLTAMSDAVELGRQLTTSSFGNLGYNATEKMPGAHIKTRQQLEEHISSKAWSHHASGTAAIGPDGDKMAVLDSKFRVRGVDGLRVVDASIWPRIPGYFVVIPTYMASEKAAASILSGDKE